MKITQKNTRVTEFKTTGAPLVALPKRLDFETTIETNFDPAEIIAMREDGTSESTNPESLKMRQDGVKKRDQASENLSKARATALANRSAENARLKVELECSNDDFRQLEAMKGRLESELKAANDELQKRPPLSTRGQLEQELSGLWDIRRSEQGVISRLRAEVLEAQEARDRFKRERDEANKKLGVAEFQEQMDITRGNRLSDEVRKLTSELKSAKADYAGLVKRHDELSAINVENYHNAIQAKAELERLKTTYSMDRVYGMSLEEVKTLKADRHKLRLALEKANRKLAHIKQTLG